MLTKEPEMLKPDAFCEHTMQQNAAATGTPPRTPLWKINSASLYPDSLARLRGRFAAGRGKEGEENGKGEVGQGQGGRERGGERRGG